MNLKNLFSIFGGTQEKKDKDPSHIDSFPCVSLIRLNSFCLGQLYLISNSLSPSSQMPRHRHAHE